MTQVLRFDLAIGENVILMPEGAEILSAGFRPKRGSVSIWARCQTAAELERRQLTLVTSGVPVSPTARYVGSAVTHDYVFHVFDDGIVE